MKRLALLLFFCFSTFILSAQKADTLKLARTKAYQKEFAEAERLLSLYNSNNNNIHALHLHAQVLYWMKKFNRSIEVYERAVNAFPNEHQVKLDYGRVLYETGRLNKARTVLNAYLAHDPNHAEANIMMAYIDLWSGHTARAKERAGKILRHYPQNEDALNILQEIKLLTAPYVKSGIGFFTDNQPLSRLTSQWEAGWYKSGLFAPLLQLSLDNFYAENNSYKTLWLQAGNKFSFSSITTDVSLTAGIYKPDRAGNLTLFTGKFLISKKLIRHLSADISYEKTPYRYTIASVQDPLLYNITEGALNFNKNDKWLGKAAYQLHSFPDNNNIHQAYIWLLLPLVNTSSFSLSAGYSGSYADAEINTYTATDTPSTSGGGGGIGRPPVFGQETSVEGIYKPYFTPENQTAHSLLASAEIAASEKTKLIAKLNVGIFGRADNPELILEENPGSEPEITTKFTEVPYHPIELEAGMQYAASPKLKLSGGYAYQNLFFYNSHSIKVELKYSFIK